MNYLTRRCTPALVLVAAFAFAACQDGAVTDPAGGEGPSLSGELEPGVQSCETISFSSFSHGDPINALSAFSTSLTVTTVGDGSRSEDQARAYDTDTEGGPDPDLEWMGSGTCPDCEGLGIVMVIGDTEGFGVEGDSPDGGTITITGFPSEGETFIDEFKGLDHEGTENPIELFVDGTKVGETTEQGNGSVETVDATDTNISTEAEFVFGGSGAVDDLVICHTPPDRGDEGCTPGYWRQPHHFDSWPSDWTDAEGQPDVDFCEVFTCDGTIALQRPETGNLNDISLLEALELRGGGVNALARHGAAAALNANGDSGVDYFYTLSEVQTIVNGALSSGEYESAKDDLAEANEQLCPLN